MTQMQSVAANDYKTAITDKFKNLKEKMDISIQKPQLRKRDFKKKQVETIELKNIIYEMKNFIRMDNAEEKISELENRSTNTI